MLRTLQRALIVIGSFLLLGVGTTNAQGVSCPALKVNDAAYELRGQEVLSNTGKLSFGVRLFWNDPDYTRPTSLEIWRKKEGEAFKKIGQVQAGKETYLDTSITKDVSSYAYYVKSIFYCGGYLLSAPIVVETSARMDVTPPVLSILSEANTPVILTKDSGLYFLLEDYESGIQIDSSTYKKEKGSATKLQTYGSNMATIARIPSSALSEGKSSVTLTVTNGAGLKTTRTFTIDIKKTDAGVLAAPVAQAQLVSFSRSLPITLSPLKDSDVYIIKTSIDRGANWPTVYEGNAEQPEIILSNIFDSSSTPGVIAVKIEHWSNNTLVTADSITMTAGDVHLVFEKTSNNTVPIAGTSIRLRDTFSDKALSIESLLTNKPQSTLTLNTDQIAPLLLMPGYYTLSENSDAYSIDTLPIISWKGDQRIPFTLTSQILSSKRSRTDEEIEILSNTKEPDEFRIIKEKIASLSAENITTGEATTYEISARIESTFCTSTCIKQTFSSTTDSLSIVWNPVTMELSTPEGLQRKENLGADAGLSKSHILFTIQGYSFQIPKTVLSQLPASTPVTLFMATALNEGVTITPSSYLVAAMEKNQTQYVPVSIGGRCNQDSITFDTSNIKVPQRLIGICTDDVNYSIISFSGPFTLSSIAQTYRTLFSSDVWFASYMNAFLQAGIFNDFREANNPLTPLTRGEFASMLRKTALLSDSSSKSDIEILQERGLIQGREVEPGVFDLAADMPINRAEVLKLLFTVFPAVHTSQNKQMPFIDIKEGKWYSEYIQRAYNLDIVEGYHLGDNTFTFYPEQQVIRAEAAKLIQEMLETMITE